jgi:hypothetical protein
MSISQQLVRKLLKAHTSSQDVNVPAATATARNQKTSRKRKTDETTTANASSTRRDNNNHRQNDRSATEDEIMEWHTRLLLSTDHIMAASVDGTKKSSKSNAAAYQKLIQRREHQAHTQQQHKDSVTNCNHGTARSSTSSLSQTSLVKIPTYNKERYEKERQEKKRHKLAMALEKLNTSSTGTRTTNKNRTKKAKKTIFG